MGFHISLFTKNLTRRNFIAGASAVGLNCLFSNPSSALSLHEPSHTAYRAALQRAVHQLLEQPIVFKDPIALKMLGLEKVRELAKNLDVYRQPGSKFLRASLVARSRLAEDELSKAYARGIRQYVILGAGLDSFAYRNPFSELHIYEIDHPDTQAWKKERLKESNIIIPPSVTFVDVDFERQSLIAALNRTEFRFDKPAFVSWLGVTMYLTPEAVSNALAIVAQYFYQGSEIVFDYLLPGDELTEKQRDMRIALSKRVQQMGEPWIGYFNTAELSAQMDQLGYKKLLVFTPEQINDRYFNDRNDNFKVQGSSRLIHASNIL